MSSRSEIEQRLSEKEEGLELGINAFLVLLS